MKSIARSCYRFSTGKSFPTSVRTAANNAPSSITIIPAVSSFHRQCRQWQSTTTTTTTTGEQAYERYLQARQKIQDIQQERERQRSQQLYEAWQRAEQAETTKKNPKATGVTVIKTLAKQTRKQQKEEKSCEDNDDDELRYWKEQMQTALQQAAVEYQHPTAWVQLGNQFLHNQQQQQQQDENEQTNNEKDDDDDDDNEKKRLNQALECYEKACELGSAEGCYNWGHLLWTGWPPQDDDDSHSTNTSSNGSSSSSSNSNSNVILQADRVKALEAFRKAIDLGDADAMYFYGVLLIDDRDTAKDGLGWIEKAADNGHGGALYYLALFYLNGNEELNIKPCKAEEFVRRLDAAVGADDPEALFLRGHSHYHGDSGYPLDYAAALRDFLAAAEKGHADAAVSAGAMLHQPSHPGIQQDQRRAFELYQYAGELGSREGWRNVVACYLTGEGVPQSKGMAKYIADTMLKDDVCDASAPS